MSENFRFGRRQFTLGAGAAGLASLLGAQAHAAKASKAGGPAIKIGYAAITWGDTPADGKGGVNQAIADISALGYPGIQLRRNITKDFKSPEELKGILEQAKLTFACLSGGGPSADATQRDAEVEKFMEAVKFAQAAGCKVVQATSPNRKDRPTIEKAELESFADTLTAIGKRCADIGVQLVFHPHMQQIGESPAEVAVIMKKADPKAVKFLMETGHWAAAGGDPVKAIREYGKSIVNLHIKDVVDKAPDEKDKKKYRFVELGQGKVDFKGVFAALKAIKFNGWAIVELDTVPKDRNPKDAAAANKKYLEDLGLVVSATA